MAVAYTETDESPREFFGVNGASAEREFYVAWEDRIQFIKEKLGFSVGSMLTIPERYDPGTGESIGSLWARDARVDPMKSPGQTAGIPWEKAKVTIIYRTNDASAFGDDGEITPPDGEVTYVTESVRGGGEYISVAKKGLWFGVSGSGGVSLDDYDLEIPSILQPLMEWQYTVHRYPVLPAEAMLTLPGKVNNASVVSRSLGMTFPAGTLLCGPIEVSREYTSVGVTLPTVTWHFIYKNNGTMASPAGWQYFLRTDTGTPTWSRITDGTDVQVIYQGADFSSVII